MKKNFIKSLILVCFLVFGSISLISEIPAYSQSNIVVRSQQQQNCFTQTTPSALVKNPKVYLNKNIKLVADFDKFSVLGLDYKPAYRSSQEYITFLIRRDDAPLNCNIPLSEAKFFLKRKYAEKFIDLTSGDKIEIEGKVFSNALGDVWCDVNKITIVKKKQK